jgi:hypothetical protein
MPFCRIVRLDGATAGDLQRGDFVHDVLTPFVVDRFESSPEHVVAVVGRLASGTTMTVRYLATTALDVSRVQFPPPPAAPGRRHLTLCPPIGGTR